MHIRGLVMAFYGREEEIKALEREYSKEGSSFCCIYGSRRIGKSSIITEFVKGKKSIFFQAKELSAQDNLVSLSIAINDFLGLEEGGMQESIEKALISAVSLLAKDNGVLVIDEYPFLVKAMPSISSIIEDLYDHRIKKTNMMLILSGSNLAFMENEILNEQSALYKRTTLLLKVNKLSFSDAKLFLNGYSCEEQAKFLSLFGPYPYYLAMINKRESFEENVKRLLFDRTSVLMNAPKDVLSNSTREQGFYNSVLLALSGKKKRLTDLALSMHEDVVKVNKYLTTLIVSQIVVKKETYNTDRQTYYDIADPVLKFYYKFLLMNIDKINNGFGLALYERMKDDIAKFISYSFENVAILYMEELSKNGKLGGIFYPFKNLTIDNSELGRSIEIDGVAEDLDSLCILECKFTNKKRGIEDYERMKENTSIKMFANFKNFYYYIISKNGFTDNILNLNDSNLHLISLEDMFK